ncbi:MAG: hypothetical protein ABIR55_03025, partial [Burkholderiaceae bacterium]
SAVVLPLFVYRDVSDGRQVAVGRLNLMQRECDLHSVRWVLANAQSSGCNVTYCQFWCSCSGFCVNRQHLRSPALSRSWIGCYKCN